MQHGKSCVGVAYSLLEHCSMMCCILAAWCDFNILVPPSVLQQGCWEAAPLQCKMIACFAALMTWRARLWAQWALGASASACCSASRYLHPAQVPPFLSFA